MRKGVCLVICIFISDIGLFAQGNTSVTKIPKKYKTFQIGAIGSLDMCFRNLDNPQNEPSIDNLIELKNNSETLKFGYHTGIGFCINASQYFGMEFGVEYSNKGYETILMDYIYSTPEPSLPTSGRSIYNYNYIDVPVKANFFLGNDKVRFYGSVGLVTNILVAQNETFVKKYEDGRTEYDTFTTNYSFDKVVFSGTVSAGIDWKINKNINLRIAPHFQHNIGRFVDTTYAMYLWNAGFATSFYFGFY